LYTQTAHLNEAQAGLVVARQVEAGNLRTAVLLASRVEGNVETLVDTQRAMLAGLTAGIAMGLVLFLVRLLTSRRR